MALTPSAPRTEAGRLRRLERRRRALVVFAVAGVVVVAGSATALLLGNRRAPQPVAAQPAAEAEASASVEATVPAPVPSLPATVTIAAVGDMQFDRQVKQLISTAGGAAPLASVAARLAGADIAVGNLESPLSNRGTRKPDKDYTFQGDPRGAEGLSLAGFDFLALGNNHMLDCGNEALADTLASLDERGIGHAGAGMNKAGAWTPAVREVRGATVAFLSFSHILPNGFIATDSASGIARGRGNMDEVDAAIRAAKAQYDYVIVSFHWGVEYQDDCNGDQVTDAHRAVDAGADMVLSHHPHVIQAVEYYNGKMIAYSLGDFVFDHYSRKTGEAFILEAELGPSGVANVRVVPVYLNGHGKPEYVSGGEAAAILERLRAISAKRGTTVQIEGDTAAVLQ